jgi:DNA-directed RNA polymerase
MLLEIEKGIEKQNKLSRRAEMVAGPEASDMGLCIANELLEALSVHIAQTLDQSHRGKGYEEALPVIKDLGPERIAWACLQACVHAAATQGRTSTIIFRKSGQILEAECWAAGLTKHDPALAKRVEFLARRKPTVATRQTRARSLAKRQGYQIEHWSDDRLIHVGSWMVAQVTERFPDWFLWAQNSEDEYTLTLTEQGLERARELLESGLVTPVWMPATEVPPQWLGFYLRSSDDPRLEHARISFLRTRNKDTIAAAKEAMANGSMAPAVAAVNSLQGVGWRINRWLYDVIRQCMENDIEVDGLPRADYTEENDAMPYPVLREAQDHNAAVRNDLALLTEDMTVAQRLLDRPFWTIVNCDWRGRVYPITHFNFQREDRVRALFLFKQGMPIGTEGLKWLKVHVANCGAFDKIDKAPIEDRIKWTTNNIDRILACVADPMRTTWWMEADKPFLFLAACYELSQALAVGLEYVTHLPVSFDGSCSGLQHLSAMTWCEQTGQLVNLTDNTRASDIYSVIADDTRARVAADCISDGNVKLPLAFVNYGITRKLVKRATMTFCYGSKKFGMAQQFQDDLMNSLQHAVLKRKIKRHPFWGWHEKHRGGPGRGARYIAGHTYEAIRRRMNKPAQAMKFLQKLSRALSHEGKPLRWTSPVGIPWINGKYEPICTRLRLWLHDRGADRRVKAKINVGLSNRIDKDASENGSAPNFVHSMDAAHLMLVVNACVAEGISAIATVHDSFGCLAPQAERFNQIIREELIKMYTEHDVLQEVLDRAKLDLTEHNWHRLPAVPNKGNLDLKEILNAKYAFA